MSLSSFCLDDSLFHRLSMASHAVRNYRNRVYHDRYNLTIVGWQILIRLYERGPSVQSQLCALNQLDKVTVSRAVTTLFRRNLLNRVASNHDRRSNHLFLTVHGEQLCHRILDDAQDIERRVFGDFDSAAASQLAVFLDRARQKIADAGHLH